MRDGEQIKKKWQKREGILRNRLINNEGQKIDKYIYSILKEEWNYSTKKRLNC